MIINKNLTIRAIAEITGLLVAMGSMIYISRVVGPEYVGFSATTSALLLLVTRLADGGLTALASQRLARDDDHLGALLTTITLPKLLAALFLIFCSLLLLKIVPVDPRLVYFVKISVFMILFEACTPAWVFVAAGQITTTSIIRIVQSLVYAAAIFFFVRQPEDWRYLPYLVLFNSAANFSLATFFLSRVGTPLFDRSVFRSNYLARLKLFYYDSLHFLKADLSVYVYTSSDRIILYYFTNSYVVGLYEAAYKIISPFYSINTVVTSTVFRDLAQAFKQGRLYPVMAKYVFVMSLLTIPLGFFLLFFSPFTINLLYGGRFADSAGSLMILGFVITFGFTSGIIVLPFSAWNMPREYGNSIFWGNLTNIAFNLALIPLLGAIGAAIATVAAKIVVTGVGYGYFKKVTDYPIVKDFAYFFAAAAMPLLVVVILARFNVAEFLLVFVYSALYLLSIAGMYNQYFKYKMSGVGNERLVDGVS